MIGHGYIREYMSVLATCFSIGQFVTKLLKAKVLPLRSTAICVSFETKVKVKSAIKPWV